MGSAFRNATVIASSCCCAHGCVCLCVDGVASLPEGLDEQAEDSTIVKSPTVPSHLVNVEKATPAPPTPITPSASNEEKAGAAPTNPSSPTPPTPTGKEPAAAFQEEAATAVSFAGDDSFTEWMNSGKDADAVLARHLRIDIMVQVCFTSRPSVLAQHRLFR